MTNNWLERQVFLKFRLGEYVFCSVPLRLNVSTHGFAELKNRSIQPTLPECENLGELDGFFIQSLPVTAKLAPIFFQKSFIRYVPLQYRRYFIDLDTSADDYLQNFSAKSRSTLRRKVKKFIQLSGGEIDWREYTNPHELKEFYRLARQISKDTYQEKLFDAGLPKGENFHQQMLTLAEQNCVKAYILFHNNTPIAYLYLPATGTALLYQYLGYHQDFAKWSPGTVLQWLVLEKLFAEREYKVFDFTAGEGNHKKFFATGNISCADVYFFKSSLKNWITVILHYLTNLFATKLVWVLDKLQLKSKIKKYFRTSSFVFL